MYFVFQICVIQLYSLVKETRLNVALGETLLHIPSNSVFGNCQESDYR